MMFLTACLVWRRRKNPGNVGKQRSRKAQKQRRKEAEKQRREKQGKAKRWRSGEAGKPKK